MGGSGGRQRGFKRRREGRRAQKEIGEALRHSCKCNPILRRGTSSRELSEEVWSSEKGLVSEGMRIAGRAARAWRKGGVPYPRSANG
jgi:hypothetical protein